MHLLNNPGSAIARELRFLKTDRDAIMSRRVVLAGLVIAGCLAVNLAVADVILSTDFTGRTVSGNTAQNIAWTTSGVTDPGDMTAVDVNSTGQLAGLYDTANAQGHFAPNLNTGNEGPWSVDVAIQIDGTNSGITVTNVVLDWQHFNNSGNFQGASRGIDWTVTFENSSSSVMGAATNLTVTGTSGLTTLTFTSPVVLPDSDTYTMEILAVGSDGNGNNTGLAGITVNGTAAGAPRASVVTIK